jgi:hypothetical protein
MHWQTSMHSHIPNGFVQVVKNSHFDPHGYVDVFLERQYEVMHPATTTHALGK